MNRSDAQLVHASMAGDPHAYGVLVTRWRGPVCGYLGGVLRGRGDDVEEFAQEAFLIAWQKLPTLKDPNRFSAWLFRIARNLATRRAQLPRPVPLVDDPPVGGDEHAVDDQMMQLMAAVAELSEPFREVVLRKYFSGDSGQKIAHDLDIAIGTVWSRLARAYELLREKLRDHE